MGFFKATVKNYKDGKVISQKTARTIKNKEALEEYFRRRNLYLKKKHGLTNTEFKRYSTKITSHRKE